tara:strand:- start:731 stop:904 length:174 start_codon:yes stop_codon:yes gene_type:complete
VQRAGRVTSHRVGAGRVTNHRVGNPLTEGTIEPLIAILRSLPPSPRIASASKKKNCA